MSRFSPCLIDDPQLAGRLLLMKQFWAIPTAAMRGLRRGFVGWFLGLLGMMSIAVQGQGVLTNGWSHSGTLTAIDTTDSWSFSASAGQGILLRAGSATLTPKIQVFDANNVLIAQATGATINFRDTLLTLPATNAGTFTVLVSPGYAGQVGNYTLTLAVASQASFVAPGDEGGALGNGLLNSGTISVGDADVWHFDAIAGDGLMLRMGSPTLTPLLRLYDPTGALVSEENGSTINFRDTTLTSVATQSGTYTLVVGAGYSGQVGSYQLSLARSSGEVGVSPADEGGELVNGALNAGSLPVGDLDVWRFSATAGEGLMLRMGATGLTPWIRLYEPNGGLVKEVNGSTINFRDSVLTASAPVSGTYTVVVSAGYSGQTGSYVLTLAGALHPIAVSLGDEGGALTNGLLQTGNIPLGDLDVWNLTAKAGETLFLRMGASQLTPWIRVYAPNGALAAEENGSTFNFRDTVVSLRATNAGSYTVVVGAGFSGQDGTYRLSLAQVPRPILVGPDDEGGVLTNGVFQSGNLPVGDVDVWAFSATAGDGLLLRMGSGTLTPWIRLFDPAGVLVGEENGNNANFRDTFLAAKATNSGDYTVVVSAGYSGQSGPYNLNLGQAPESFVVSPGDEGGLLVNGVTNRAVLERGDLDLWSFYGTVGDSNVLRVLATNFTPWIRLYGPAGELVKEVVAGNANARQGILSQVISNAGNYTVLVTAAYEQQAGPYSFKQSRWAPDLNVPATQTLDEGATLEFSISAQDPDVPETPLQFKLISGPANLIRGAGDATHAAFSWATTEADGPSTNLLVFSVTDVVNGQPFVRTNSFTVVVREINQAPQLTVPADQILDELTPLTVDASASDADLPANPLTFSLVAPPAGMTIEATTGLIHWTPSEAQGPSTQQITVVVTDESPSAANAVHLSTTNRFTVVVREINSPPQLTVPSLQTLDELASLNVTAVAVDSDLPANGLSFRFNGTVPAGLTLDAGTGAIRWVPTEEQGPSTNSISVVVTDSNPPAANAQQWSVTNSFLVVVREVNAAPVLTVPGQQTIDELSTLKGSVSASDADVPRNALNFGFVGVVPSGMTLDSITGAFSWTPTEAQGPSTNVMVVRVQDDGTPSRSVTNQFVVVVRELNTKPVLPVQGLREVKELALLSVTNTAVDSDLPANQLTYTLVSGPAGAVISSGGIITWTPTEAQGPSTNEFTTVVSDDGAPGLLSTNSFLVIVGEVNQAPSLKAIDHISLHYGATLSLTASGTDLDFPANALRYQLDQAPTNLTIHATSGLLTWVPVQAQVGVHSVTVRVSDDASPSLSSTRTFQITVTGDESRLALKLLGAGFVQLSLSGDVGFSYELQKSSNLSSWEVLSEFRLNVSPFVYLDPDPATSGSRFYRMVLKP